MIAKITPKIGIFISDEGRGLGRAIDLPAVVSRLGKIKNISLCEVLTREEISVRLAGIQNLLQEGKINRIIWVGRFSEYQQKKIEDELAAAGLNRYLHEWCNPEEQGIGDSGGDREILTQKTVILIQMAVARARLLQPLEPVTIPGTNAVLIVGAGAAGLHTAVSLVEQGKKVFLVEKESGVGERLPLSGVYIRAFAILSAGWNLLCRNSGHPIYVKSTVFPN